jgi:hypothetical protein
VTNARFISLRFTNHALVTNGNPPASPEREASACGTAAALPLAEPQTEATV